MRRKIPRNCCPFILEPRTRKLQANDRKHEANVSSYYQAQENSSFLSESAWSEGVDAHLSQILLNYLFEDNSDVNFEKFLEPLLYVTRGSEDEKITAVYKMLSAGSKEIKLSAIHEYVEHIFTSYMETYRSKKTRNFESWKVGQNIIIQSDQLQALVKHLCKDLPVCSEVSLSDLTTWVTSWNLLFTILQKVVFNKIYNILDEDTMERYNTIPFWNRIISDKSPSVLTWPSIVFLNAGLPSKLQSEWRLLFSTVAHGESFSKLIGCIMNKGPTIVIVRDRDGHVFGGFAPSSWTLSPNYVGDDSSFLFSILPVMERFEPTGYNDHYQYLNVQQQTLPNGLGMGGQHNYFGFWLDAEFGSGHCSETCTTYRNYHMLSAQKCFQIEHVEAWGVGPEPEVEEESKGRSVLDTQTEARAVMEMAGKVQYSDGYREPEED
ncbi:MTOR-associated protein MEAK7-like isoform X3 [Schistocerca cancellata]|uniref:MTOR-associated protein MEAK7-like isoform X3 n=1 Tax=Schistocerca cancellata TaxID=274614 RepID=UPI0021195B95|nr:MTOR-associated protein MEAK7-like isoform X3 [Schistocerca cancellata]